MHNIVPLILVQTLIVIGYYIAENHPDCQVLEITHRQAALDGPEQQQFRRQVYRLAVILYFFLPSTVGVKLERIMPISSGIISTSGNSPNVSNHSIGGGMDGSAVLAIVQMRL